MYGGLLVLAGAILLGVNYALVRRGLARDHLAIGFEVPPGPVVIERRS